MRKKLKSQIVMFAMKLNILHLKGNNWEIRSQQCPFPELYILVNTLPFVLIYTPPSNHVVSLWVKLYRINVDFCFQFKFNPRMWKLFKNHVLAAPVFRCNAKYWMVIKTTSGFFFKTLKFKFLYYGISNICSITFWRISFLTLSWFREHCCLIN